jgi:hypothetical protein
LGWSAIGGTYLNDLLPLPYAEESLDIFCDHGEQAQEALGRRLLIQNPPAYLRYCHSPIPEAEFIAEIAPRTGCGILCDVNKIHFSAWNSGSTRSPISTRCGSRRSARSTSPAITPPKTWRS